MRIRPTTEINFMFAKKTVVIYANKSGREPFSDWLISLKDRTFRARIRNRISRLELGNLGDCEPIGDGIFSYGSFLGPGLEFTSQNMRAQ
jgi:putative addiction module killer protein